jgi:hypothetical protein
MSQDQKPSRRKVRSQFYRTTMTRLQISLRFPGPIGRFWFWKDQIVEGIKVFSRENRKQRGGIS